MAEGIYQAKGPLEENRKEKAHGQDPPAGKTKEVSPTNIRAGDIEDDGPQVSLNKLDVLLRKRKD